MKNHIMWIVVVIVLAGFVLADDTKIDDIYIAYTGNFTLEGHTFGVTTQNEDAVLMNRNGQNTIYWKDRCTFLSFHKFCLEAASTTSARFAIYSLIPTVELDMSTNTTTLIEGDDLLVKAEIENSGEQQTQFFLEIRYPETFLFVDGPNTLEYPEPAMYWENFQGPPLQEQVLYYDSYLQPNTIEYFNFTIKAIHNITKASINISLIFFNSTDNESIDTENIKVNVNGLLDFSLKPPRLRKGDEGLVDIKIKNEKTHNVTLAKMALVLPNHIYWGDISFKKLGASNQYVNPGLSQYDNALLYIKTLTPQQEINFSIPVSSDRKGIYDLIVIRKMYSTDSNQSFVSIEKAPVEVIDHTITTETSTSKKLIYIDDTTTFTTTIRNDDHVTFEHVNVSVISDLFWFENETSLFPGEEKTFSFDFSPEKYEEKKPYEVTFKIHYKLQDDPAYYLKESKETITLIQGNRPKHITQENNTMEPVSFLTDIETTFELPPEQRLFVEDKTPSTIMKGDSLRVEIALEKKGFIGDINITITLNDETVIDTIDYDFNNTKYVRRFDVPEENEVRLSYVVSYVENGTPVEVSNQKVVVIEEPLQEVIIEEPVNVWWFIYPLLVLIIIIAFLVAIPKKKAIERRYHQLKTSLDDDKKDLLELKKVITDPQQVSVIRSIERDLTIQEKKLEKLKRKLKKTK